MKVLVTGGAGFIGSHLCARLLDAGHVVLCVDNLLTGSLENLAGIRTHPDFTFRQHDVIEPFEAEVEAIYHLASPASPVAYLHQPIETILVNSQGTYHLLEIARKQQARFLLASTSEIYGDPLVHPQKEEYWGNVNTIGPRACYDESKRLAETWTMEYYRQFQVDVRIVRIFNTYGPHSQIADGRMVPNFIAQALRQEPLIIYGDGGKTRSICYVDDLVEGLMRAMFMTKTTGEVFNLGNTEEHTVLKYAQTIVQLCQAFSPVPGAFRIEFAEARVDDPERRRPNITRAQRVLGWQPKTRMQDGLQRTIAWFSQRINAGVQPSLVTTEVLQKKRD